MAEGHGYLFLTELVGERYQPLVSAGLVACGLTIGWYVARRQLLRRSDASVPEPKLTAANLLDFLLESLMKLSDNVMGHHNRKYLPFLCTLFMYIFAMNALGLVPGFAMPTSTFTMNFGVAITVFILYHSWGIRSVGLRNYLKHFVGPVIYIAPLMIPIETISHCVRPFSLSLRLYGNMLGDHAVLTQFTHLTKFVIPVIFYGVGTFVCALQAFVFTLLTMIYIRLAVTHEEGHH